MPNHQSFDLLPVQKWPPHAQDIAQHSQTGYGGLTFRFYTTHRDDKDACEMHQTHGTGFTCHNRELLSELIAEGYVSLNWQTGCW